MALFGDERRFHPGIRQNDGLSAVYGKESVGENLGPGLHYERDLDDKRMGWTPTNSTKRQPMRKNEKESDRSDFYVKNQLTSSGAIIPHASDRHSFPSPGQYEPDNSADYASRRKSTIQKSYLTPGISSKGPSYSMGTSPRMTSQSTIIRVGFLVSGGGLNDDTTAIRGPGSYFQTTPNDLPATTLIHKSSNVRSNSGNSKGVETAKDHLATTTMTPRTTITPRQSNLPSPESYRRHSPNKEKPTSPSFGSPRYAIHTPILGSPRLSPNSNTPFRAAKSHKGYLNGGPGGGYGPGVPEPSKESHFGVGGGGSVAGGGGDYEEAGGGTGGGGGGAAGRSFTSTPTGRGTPTGLYAATPTRHKSDR